MLNRTLSNLQALLEPTHFKGNRTVVYAELLCKQAHWTQIDRDGKPHWVHALEVAKMMGPNQRLQIIALLHDVREDCKDKNILAKVQQLIYNDSAVGFALDNLTKRPGESRAMYIARVCRRQDSIIVKMADIRHNLSRLEPERIVKRRKYERELRTLLKALWKLNGIYINNAQKQAETLANCVFI